MGGVASPFDVSPHTREIGENTPHQLGADGKKVGAILPVHLPKIDQPQIHLVDQGSGLEGMAGRLVSHVALGHLMQFPVHEGRQLLKRTFIPVAPSPEQSRYFVSGGPSHGTP